MYDKRIAIIGCGNLGLAILHGLLSDKNINPGNLTITRRNIDELIPFRDSGISVTSDNAEAIRKSEIIIVGLKPYTILDVLREVKDSINPDHHLVISLATGISLFELQNAANSNVPMFRAMPNTAADVGVSMTCIASKGIDGTAYATVKQVFDTIGTTIRIDEDLMNSATVLGACGIAYVLRFIRGMIQGGIEIGFDAATATKIVTQTVKGASELLIQRKEHPEFEIDKVTTPRGCTIAGLNEMEHNGFSSALIKGIVTSHNKIGK